MKRAHFIRGAAFAVLAGAASLSFAEGTQQVRLLLGFPAGGPVDAIARSFAAQARLVTGDTYVVENRIGASGKLAIDALLAAPADGLTIMVAPASLIELAPMVMANAKYDPAKDFSAIGSLAEYGFGIAAGPAAGGARDLAAYKAWAKANPDKSSFASPGLGTPQQFLGVQLQKAMGIDLLHVPYKGGALAITDVMGGQLPLLITTEQLLVPYQSQGKLDTLFITTRKRNPMLPGVPTAREVGLPQLETDDWFGAFVKAGTPPEKIKAWREQVRKVVASPGYVDTLKKLGFEVPDKQPADFTALIKSESAIWGERVKLSGFKPTE